MTRIGTCEIRFSVPYFLFTSRNKLYLQRIAPEAVHTSVCLNMVETYRYGQVKDQVIAATITKGSIFGVWRVTKKKKAFSKYYHCCLQKFNKAITILKTVSHSATAGFQANI